MPFIILFIKHNEGWLLIDFSEEPSEQVLGSLQLFLYSEELLNTEGERHSLKGSVGFIVLEFKNQETLRSFLKDRSLS